MDYDLIVIGSGPGGYVPAIRAGQTGLKTAVIEKGKTGGMCLNRGCIPTKSLIESAKLYRKLQGASEFGIDGIYAESLRFNYPAAVKRAKRIVARLTKGVEFLLKKNGVDLINGEAVIKDRHSVKVDNRLLTTRYIMIATGSEIEPLPDRFKEVENVSIEGMLEIKDLPDTVFVAGSGIHSFEVAQFLRLTGREVSLITSDPASLKLLDDFLLDHLYKQFTKEKIRIADLTEIRIREGKAWLGEDENPAGLVINAGKRRAVVPGNELGLTPVNGFLEVDENLNCGGENIFAVGDVNGRSPFAHAASAQGLFAVNRIRGVKAQYDPGKIPVNIYTYPEMAQVGLTEQEIIKRKTEYKVSEFPLTANGKALTEGESEGLVRVLSETTYGEVLGVQIIAANATDMIAEASVLMGIEATVFDMANIIHAHPTVSEVFYEAGQEALDMAIHK